MRTEQFDLCLALSMKDCFSNDSYLYMNNGQVIDSKTALCGSSPPFATSIYAVNFPC